jgi:hypothetical protein
MRAQSALIHATEATVPDPIEHLVSATAAAIRNERPSLEHNPGSVRGLTVELDGGASTSGVAEWFDAVEAWARDR